jgi:hypothetical protein
MMNCQEFKIWVESANEEEFIHPNADIKQHLSSCEKCNKDYVGLFQAYGFMNVQRNSKLPDFTSQSIINKLEEFNYSSKQKKNKPLWVISRIAAVFIISAGIATGIIAGSILFSKPKTNENSWSTEFSSLDEEQDYYSYLFD